MKTITAIGLDIAKSVFQVRGIDGEGKVAIRKQLKRARVIPFFMKLPPSIAMQRQSVRRCSDRTCAKGERRACRLGGCSRTLPAAIGKTSS
jgi:transposase